MESNQRVRNRRLADTAEGKMAEKGVLPSRAEYHGKKRKPKKESPANKKKKKVSVPLILLIVLLLLPIGILSIINNGDRSKANPVSSGSGEEVSFDETEDPVSETPSQSEESDEGEGKSKSADSKDQTEKKVDEPVKKTEEKPPAETNGGTETQQNETQDQSEGNVTYHTVQQGENLFRIAMKYYNSQEGVEKIKQANGLAGNEISVGQTLKIPLP